MLVFIPRHFETKSLLKSLIHKEVAKICFTSQKTLQECRWEILCQIAEWLNISKVLNLYQDEIPRNQLITLLLTDVKHKNMKHVPQDEMEWTRQLNSWLRNNAIGSNVKDRTIYRLLAVDGFEGLEPKYLKLYLKNVFDPRYIRHEYRLHIIAIRKMYDWFETDPAVSSLTGTDSGCVVFLALLHLYMTELNHLLLDDQIALQANCAREWAEGFLYRNANYYNDVRNVNNNMLETVIKIYKDAWKETQEWKQVGKEYLQNLNNKIIKTN